MTTAAAFVTSPADVLRAIADADPEATPEEIAESALETLSARAAAAWLEVALPAYVREVTGQSRTVTPVPIRDDADRPPRTSPAPGPQHAGAGDPRRSHGRGWRRDAAARYSAKWMAQRIDITGDGERYQPIGLCTASELRHAADCRREWLAGVTDRVTAAATFLENIADAVDAAAVTVVADLPAIAAAAIAAP